MAGKRELDWSRCMTVAGPGLLCAAPPSLPSHSQSASSEGMRGLSDTDIEFLKTKLVSTQHDPRAPGYTA